MSDTQNNVIDLNRFRDKKKHQNEVNGGRKPLFVSHVEGVIKGSPHLSRPDAEQFGSRIERIKQSLEKINMLMAELRKQSEDRTRRSDPPKPE